MAHFDIKKAEKVVVSAMQGLTVFLSSWSCVKLIVVFQPHIVSDFKKQVC